MTILNTALLGVTGLLGLVGVAEGVKKFTGAHAEAFERFGYPQWSRLAVGTLELVGGAALLAGLVVGNTLTMAGGFVVGAVLAGAVATHVRVGDSPSELAPPAVLLAFAVVVVTYNAELIV